jgi:hypothetical protein
MLPIVIVESLPAPAEISKKAHAHKKRRPMMAAFNLSPASRA